MIAILILAAGRSSRMQGTDKLMQPVQGAPLIRTMALRALHCDVPVYATVPDLNHPRAHALRDLSVHVVGVPAAVKGMGHSIAGGIHALGDGCDAVMIVPCDMPELDQHDFQTMLDHYHHSGDNTVLRGSSESGVPGHPVVFQATHFDALQKLSGDSGAKQVLLECAASVSLIALPKEHALTDLDTQSEWIDWNANNGL